MNIWLIPVRMPPARVHMRADPRLAFEVVGALGTSQPDGSGSRVLRTEPDGRLLVEFRSRVPTLRGGNRIRRTVEHVTLRSPERIDFAGVEGPLRVLRDRFTFADIDGCTEFTYESTFAIGWSIVGWLIGRLYARPLLGRFMREHVQELRAMVEARAAGSRQYHQPACAHCAVAAR